MRTQFQFKESNQFTKYDEQTKACYVIYSHKLEKVHFSCPEITKYIVHPKPLFSLPIIENYKHLLLCLL